MREEPLIINYTTFPNFQELQRSTETHVILPYHFGLKESEW